MWASLLAGLSAGLFPVASRASASCGCCGLVLSILTRFEFIVTIRTRSTIGSLPGDILP